jgi:hypothetical protein
MWLARDPGMFHSVIAEEVELAGRHVRGLYLHEK